MSNGTHVTWKQLTVLAVIITGVLSVIWTEVRNNGDDIVEIKVNTARTGEKLDNLIREIRGGEITIIRNYESNR